MQVLTGYGTHISSKRKYQSDRTHGNSKCKCQSDFMVIANASVNQAPVAQHIEPYRRPGMDHVLLANTSASQAQEHMETANANVGQAKKHMVIANASANQAWHAY